MKTDFTQHIRTCAVAALAALAVSLSGCASGGSGAANANSGAKSVSEEAAAAERCRAAIADVSRMCEQDTGSSRCTDAKARSRNACI